MAVPVITPLAPAGQINWVTKRVKAERGLVRVLVFLATPIIGQMGILIFV